LGDGFPRSQPRPHTKWCDSPLLQLQEGKTMSDDFKDYLSNYKKDPKKEYESEKEKARRKANKSPQKL
jgi:hypothetical protein